MPKKIDCVLFVDDNPLTNFFNKKVLSAVSNDTKVVTMESAEILLDFLKREGNYKTETAVPNIIFLDINMPRMDGFEFLEYYNQLESDLVKDILIVFLTTSIRNRDRSKAFDNDFVYDFVAKPFTEEVYLKIARFYAENYRS